MFPDTASVPVRAWIWSWVPEVQLGPAVGVPENVSGPEFRLGAVPQMVPPVTVKPPAERPMESAAVLLSVSVPPLVSELFPSKPTCAALDRVMVPSLVRAGSLPLLPTVSEPSMVNEPLDVVVNAPPVLVLALMVPLLAATSKEPLLVKVVVLPTLRVPPASCTSPLLVNEAAVEMPELTTIV